MYFFIICYAFIILYNFIKGKKAMHMLQQNLYNENNRYIKWMDKNIKTCFLHLDIASSIIVLGAFILNNKLSNMLIIGAFIVYIMSGFIILETSKKEQVKKPLVITARVKRLIVTSLLLFLLPVLIYITNSNQMYLSLFMLSLLTCLNYCVIYLAKVINTPVERLVYKKFYRQSQKKLKSMPNLKVIGITGSYGKTSSKNILANILNTKYIARPTPRNLNTEYGLMITINNHVDKFDEILIAEMGAYKQGEIKTLCDMVHPKYGILTSIGTAHLESFGSEENIQKTKFELIESLPEDGIAILNLDDKKQREYDLKNNVKVIWIGINEKKADVIATNIKCTNKGSKFDIKFKGDKKLYPFETKLLGNNNIYNILASVALGHELGMKIEELQQGVRKVKSIEHRLELKQIGNIYMIDDAYNSNPVGAKSALDVLDMMDGTKVVVTPGMVELGDKQDEYNKEFGKQIATVADYVILVGEKITKSIHEGLLESGYNKEKIYILNDVTKAYPLIESLKKKKDIYALFENDLPDNYNE